MRRVKVLVVDDSPTMRALLVSALSSNDRIVVVGTASDALAARNAIRAYHPDVITLDVEMPGMTGLEFLERLMRFRPMPVVMVSSLTKAGADATIRAFEAGAVACIAKPSISQPLSFEELVPTVLAAAEAIPQRARAPQLRPAASAFNPGRQVVGIGASTGGVEALVEILRQFPENCPPTLVTQHMPKLFTRSFAERLNRLCLPRVKEAADGDVLSAGTVYVAPGGPTHLQVSGIGPGVCRVSPGPPVSGHTPSIDMLLSSLAIEFGKRAIGVILTGMGSDGAAGLGEIRRMGGYTIGQDRATSVVYGMPKVAFESGAVEKQLPLQLIAGEILHAAQLR